MFSFTIFRLAVKDFPAAAAVLSATQAPVAVREPAAVLEPAAVQEPAAVLEPAADRAVAGEYPDSEDYFGHLEKQKGLAYFSRLYPSGNNKG